MLNEEKPASGGENTNEPMETAENNSPENNPVENQPKSKNGFGGFWG